jgi:hypothetical protein
MHPLLFPDALQLSHEDFEIEVVPEGCRAFPHLLESIQEEVLYIATRSRGWDERSLEHMRRHFKLGPLYEANALVLIRKDGVLVGLAGSVNDWHVEQGSLIHLCSLGLLPEAQQRGFLPVMLAFVWILTLRSPQAREDFQNRCAFITAITQSPYLYAMLHRLFDLYPSPERLVIPGEIREIAHAVVKRFDEELDLDEERLILRNECRFFYQRIPYSPNRSLNSFCDRNLRYQEGDVFVLVGRVIPEKVERYIASIASTHAELFSRFCSVLESRGDEAVSNPLNAIQRKSFHA